jgi:uncharacterized protein with HEPN domain
VRDDVYFRHILASIERIEQYTLGINEVDFSANFMIQDAVVRNLEIIGEVSSKISTETKDINKVVPWREMKLMRNYIAHEYFAVDIEVIWNTVTIHLPILKGHIQTIIKDSDR